MIHHTWSRYQTDRDVCESNFSASITCCMFVSVLVFITTLFGVADRAIGGRVYKQIWFVFGCLIVTWFLLMILYYHRLSYQWFKENILWTMGWLKDNGLYLCQVIAVGITAISYVYVLVQVAIHLIQ